MKHFFTLTTIALSVLLFQCIATTKESKEKKSPFTLLQQASEETLAKTMWHNADTTISNEARLDIFKEAAVQAKGGVYIGVGSIQNLTLAAWAQSEFIYLMDFTEVVVLANKAHIAFIKDSPTPTEYLTFWKPGNNRKAEEILKKYYSNTIEYNGILDAFHKSRPFFQMYQTRMKLATTRYAYKIYYQDDLLYQHIRKLALENKIKPIRGNLLGSTTLQSIGESTRLAGMKVNIIYLSNAEEYSIFKPYPETFIKNITSLPIDTHSVILRTISVYKWTHDWAKGSEIIVNNGFHYGAQSLSQFQECLSASKQLYVYDMFKAGKTVKQGFTYPACPAS